MSVHAEQCKVQALLAKQVRLLHFLKSRSSASAAKSLVLQLNICLKVSAYQYQRDHLVGQSTSVCKETMSMLSQSSNILGQSAMGLASLWEALNHTSHQQNQLNGHESHRLENLYLSSHTLGNSHPSLITWHSLALTTLTDRQIIWVSNGGIIMIISVGVGGL